MLWTLLFKLVLLYFSGRLVPCHLKANPGNVEIALNTEPNAFKIDVYSGFQTAVGVRIVLCNRYLE